MPSRVRTGLSVVWVGISLTACAAARPSPQQPATNVLPAAAVPRKDRDSLLGRPSDREIGPPSSDLDLMPEAYSLARQRANPEVTTTIQADILAQEAATFALLGDRDEALALWLEAISLLQTARTDTLPSQPPRKPPP
jgi:hypothetical protein